MSTSMHRIINTITGEVTNVAFTEKELADYEIAANLEQDKLLAKLRAKAALLDRLGITADEATLLLA